MGLKKMKVVKISKSITSSVVYGYIILYNDIEDNDYIDELVENWCDEDLSGHNFGYSWEWEFLENEKEIEKVISNELNNVNYNIKDLEYKKNMLEDYLEIKKYNV